MRRTIAVDGPDEVDEVWQRYAVAARWRSWSTPIRRVESSSERLVAGMTGVVHGPPGVRVRFVVDAVDDDAHAWRWGVRSARCTWCSSMPWSGRRAVARPRRSWWRARRHRC